MKHHDVVGIGAGPANMSLAALAQAHTDLSLALFDAAPASRWHADLLHPGVRMQSSWLKDLVTLVDPTNPLSFLSYLVDQGRLFALLNAQFDFIPRAEYMRYLAWAAERIDGLHHDTPVDEVDFVEGRGFVTTSRGVAIATSDHLVLGVGTRSRMPDALAELPPEQVFVADRLTANLPAILAAPDAPIAVVGGGQTGIEAVLRLREAGCTDVRWLGRRQWFATIDDSPAANEFYRPAHQQFLQGLSAPTRRRLVDDHEVTADALTPGKLRSLYQLNYDGLLTLGRFPVTLLPGRDVVAGRVTDDDVTLTAVTAERVEEHCVRRVVVAVGREAAPLPVSRHLRERLDVDEAGEVVVQPDWSVQWKGPDGHRIYALNRSRFGHGIPDANLTLLPVRSALVLNSITERQLFTITDDLCPVSWG